MRLFLTSLSAAAVLLGASALPIHADDDLPSVIAIIVQAADGYSVSAVDMLRVAECESALNPSAVGDHGTSFGLFQLHRGGLLTSAFLPWGFTDPLDPEQAADFVARWIALTGNWQPWTCARWLGIH